jgi:hypothetical protein
MNTEAAALLRGREQAERCSDDELPKLKDTAGFGARTGAMHATLRKYLVLEEAYENGKRD